MLKKPTRARFTKNNRPGRLFYFMFIEFPDQTYEHGEEVAEFHARSNKEPCIQMDATAY